MNSLPWTYIFFVFFLFSPLVLSIIDSKLVESIDQLYKNNYEDMQKWLLEIQNPQQLCTELVPENNFQVSEAKMDDEHGNGHYLLLTKDHKVKIPAVLECVVNSESKTDFMYFVATDTNKNWIIVYDTVDEENTPVFAIDSSLVMNEDDSRFE